MVRGTVCGTLEHRNLECYQERTNDEVMTHNEQICARFVVQMRHRKNRQHSDGVWTIGRLFYLVSQIIIKQGGSVHDMERERSGQDSHLDESQYGSVEDTHPQSLHVSLALHFQPP